MQGDAEDVESTKPNDETKNATNNAQKEKG